MFTHDTAAYGNEALLYQHHPRWSGTGQPLMRPAVTSITADTTGVHHCFNMVSAASVSVSMNVIGHDLPTCYMVADTFMTVQRQLDLLNQNDPQASGHVYKA